MIFLILPVWWVPCFLVPILPVLSLVPWWCTLCHPPERGATRKDTRIERKKTTGEQHLNMKITRFKSEVLFHILFRCLFMKKRSFQNMRNWRVVAYPLANLETKITKFHIGKPSSTPTSTRSVVPDRFMLSALMGSYEKASFIRSWPRKPSHEPKLWRLKFKGFWTR